MINKEDLEYILSKLPIDDSKNGKKVKQKLAILHQQMILQEEFRNKSLTLQQQMEEILK